MAESATRAASRARRAAWPWQCAPHPLEQVLYSIFAQTCSTSWTVRSQPESNPTQQYNNNPFQQA
jgi:hypothetical protein